MVMFAFLMYMQIDHYTVNILTMIPEKSFWILFGFLAAFSFLLPVLVVNFFVSAKIVSDWEMNDKKERVPVLIASTIFLVVLYYVFFYFESKSGDLFHGLFGVIMSAIVLGLLGALISNFWKISLHSIGISGLAGSIFGLTATLDPVINQQEMVLYNSALLLLVGIVGFARLHQKAHNVMQVLAGMFLGFGVSFVIVNNGWYF